MTKTLAPFPKSTILGYPRIGENRELKKSEELYWGGKITLDEFENETKNLRIKTYEKLKKLGLNEDYSIPMSFSYYDQMLDLSVMSGIIPNRFEYLRKTADNTSQVGREIGSFGERMRRKTGEDELDLDAYFTIARGDKKRGADGLPGEMTKWFDTNYHYIVPEISENTRPYVASWQIVRQFEEALLAGIAVRPQLVGPVTFLALAKYENTDYTKILDSLIAVYARVLYSLASKGCQWVQIDEPAFVSQTHNFSIHQIKDISDKFYNEIAQLFPQNGERPQILVTAPFESVGENEDIYINLPIEAIHFDMVHGYNQNSKLENLAEKISENSEITAKTIVLGLINGRNIWRLDNSSITQKNNVLERITSFFKDFSISTSCSMQHVPHTIANEPKLQSEQAELVSNLSFADEKIREVIAVSNYFTTNKSINTNREEQAVLQGRNVESVRSRVSSITPNMLERESIDERKLAQSTALNLPLLPTTTIGSFPQTAQIRKSRASFKNGLITNEQYTKDMQNEIENCVKLQEEIGLDVLVHGEAERNDMVQYFAENFDGFAVTENGWVQSYGSRCTKPSILWGDVSRESAFTVFWSEYAQSLTEKPMKGMLTGPVTILAWSFVRDDQPKSETANQVALALQDEINDLENAGIRIIQVDEPALRELLPLKKVDHENYLKWSVNSFKLATSSVKVSTQIHTHLCYSEFEVVLPAIIGLNADVTSIEAARSKMEIITGLVESKYPLGIGPGVYDIHSPRIPDVNEIENLLNFACNEFKNGNLPLSDFWVNPDCGLKTRNNEESTPSLINMVNATKNVRKNLQN